jgi:hypothetical protein
MAASDNPYIAIRVIMFNDVRAFNPGDVVPSSAVDGPDAWLEVGTDVEVRSAHKPDRPSRNASQALWAAYAVGQGADAEQVKDASRADLIKAYGGDDSTSEPVSGGEDSGDAS